MSKDGVQIEIMTKAGGLRLHFFEGFKLEDIAWIGVRTFKGRKASPRVLLRDFQKLVRRD